MNLTLHLTTACNMRCGYCYAPPRPGEGMSLEVAEQAMDLALRSGGGDPVGLAFFGGEPLVELPRLEAIVASAEARAARGEGPVRFKLTTNGLAMDDAFLDWAEAHRVKVAVSVDGVRAAHDAHRRLPGGGPSFDRIPPEGRQCGRRTPGCARWPSPATVRPGPPRSVRGVLRSCSPSPLWRGTHRSGPREVMLPQGRFCGAR